MAERDPRLEQNAVETIRFLAVDAIEKAASGHPGMPMGMADSAFVLWDRFLRHDPTRPDWPGRDRFLLSAGHGSMLLYALLHLSGYDLPLEQLQRFRQWDSRTPGHPERGLTPGVETTTGPLGQGFGNGVGLALAAKLLGARLNTDDFAPIDWRVYALVSDGDLMEGVAAEVASLAGHLQLGNLIALYDDNHISIEGETELAFSEDVAARFAAYGWHVQRTDGHDRQAVAAAFEQALADERPSLICARTHIAFGSPGKQDTAAAHGAPLGAEEVAATKRARNWPLEPTFHVPEAVGALFAARREALTRQRQAWERDFAAWRQRHPERARLWDALHQPQRADTILPALIEAAGDAPAATRALSGKVLNKAAEHYPGLIGGSADLAPSNKTLLADQGSVGRGDFGARNLHFGIREHGMAAMLNGMALSDALIPYGGTFLVFADYMRPSIRLAALVGLGPIYVFTHDSIFVGEDGPTHQPIEQLASLRCIPNLVVYRPADGLETAAGWATALSRRNAPTALVLSRQKLPPLQRPTSFQTSDALRGAYVLVEEKDGVEAAVVASGSEVAPAAEAAAALGIRCVSMPSRELFFDLPQAERDALLPPHFAKAAVEASRDPGWYQLVGSGGLVYGLDRFGASAPAPELGARLGFDDASILEALRGWLES